MYRRKDTPSKENSVEGLISSKEDILDFTLPTHFQSGKYAIMPLKRSIRK